MANPLPEEMRGQGRKRETGAGWSAATDSGFERPLNGQAEREGRFETKKEARSKAGLNLTMKRKVRHLHR
jgi:hypothetical protein